MTLFDLINNQMDDPIGRWIVYAAIFVVAVIGGLYLFFRIKSRLDKLVDSISIVKDQVANDHKYPDGTPINMRDDLDGKHSVTDGKLDLVIELVRNQGKSIGALQDGQASLQSGQTSLYKLILANTDDIEALQALSDTKTRVEINKIIEDNHNGKHAEHYAG